MDRFVILMEACYLLHKAVEIASRTAGDERRDLELTDPAVREVQHEDAFVE
jgi:hypothetical protein